MLLTLLLFLISQGKLSPTSEYVPMSIAEVARGTSEEKLELDGWVSSIEEKPFTIVLCNKRDISVYDPKRCVKVEVPSWKLEGHTADFQPKFRAILFVENEKGSLKVIGWATMKDNKGGKS